MASESPFGQPTRMKVLQRYFESAGPVTAENAWEHVYRCMLWIDESAGLPHIYDSNHMQPAGPFQRRGTFHTKAVRFTEALCARWGVQKNELANRIDYLFKGIVEELRRRRAAAKPKPQDTTRVPSELVPQIAAILKNHGINDDSLANEIEGQARDYFTIGKKRSNALGEGFEDLLTILIGRAAAVPPEKVKLRTPVSQLPGFGKPPPPAPGQKKRREPTPDLAIVGKDFTRAIVSAKWSMRQDRQQQFAFEFRDFQFSKEQSLELNYSLITNEFDLARLNNVADATPTSTGGYIFHQIYHINLDLLRETHAGKLGRVEHFIGTGKIRSLENFLNETKAQFGA